MSLEWCKEHCPKTHRPKGVQSQYTVGRAYWCPVYPDYMGKCFIHCNLDSDRVCGDCVHWYGHCTTEPEGQPLYNSNGRHALYGSCPFQITGVSASWHNDCPHFRKRPKDFDWAFIDWVEDQIEQMGLDPAASTTRPVRIKIRKQWFDMWDNNSPRLG